MRFRFLILRVVLMLAIGLPGMVWSESSAKADAPVHPCHEASMTADEAPQSDADLLCMAFGKACCSALIGDVPAYNGLLRGQAFAPDTLAVFYSALSIPPTAPPRL